MRARPRRRDDDRPVALHVEAEVHAFERQERFRKLSPVRLLAAVERGVAAEAEAGRGDASPAPYGAHV